MDCDEYLSYLDREKGGLTLKSRGYKMGYTAEMRRQIIDAAVGRTIDSLEWNEDNNYWTMKFSDGYEFSFRFMAEINNV